MVFLDLDNTLLPTRMDQILRTQTGMNIYESCASSLQQLQHCIIAAIDKIRDAIKIKNKKLVVAIVSNANAGWIREHLSPDLRSTGLPILGMFGCIRTPFFSFNNWIAGVFSFNFLMHLYTNR